VSILGVSIKAIKTPTAKKPKSKPKKVTPLMTQYFEIKRKHPDAILLFRVGDFYETFGEDAVKAAGILGIVLTSRNNGGSDIELAGFPYHSVDVYLPKLVQAGYRVAICEQMEKPSKEKKIVRRDVTEVVTPGVTTHDNILNAGQNNFLASIHIDKEHYGIAFLDISTGEFIVHEGSKASIQKLLQSFTPNELLVSKAQQELLSESIDEETFVYGLDEWYYEHSYAREILLKHFNVLSLKGFGVESKILAQIAAGTILHYLSTIQQANLSHINKLVKLESDKYMWLDKFTIRNLELIRSNHQGGKGLISIIDKTCSPMGARMLQKWILLPLKDIAEIKARQERVKLLLQDESKRAALQTKLKTTGDLERLTSKIPLGKVNPRELLTIANALDLVDETFQLFEEDTSEAYKVLLTRMNRCDDLKDLIRKTLSPDAPVNFNKGQVIQDGWNETLDEWRDIANNGKDKLTQVQVRESEATGIASLKIGFNNVFGYYLEVTNKYKDKDLIPENWIRKQTLKSAERYITPELKELESKILQAQNEINLLEEQLYKELVDKTMTYVSTLLENAKVLAELDCYQSLSEVAEKHRYTLPIINDGYTIDIKAGRHPVIEVQLPPDDPYVPNDVYLNRDDQQIIMITGPNMSGKSAVLRQTALICLLAHMGSYVPADAATIGIVDKIFTRVGASDNISSGESTFMVEMNETSSILNNLSERSLILLDEIGRGTSTYDGISIAWSIAEYVHDHKDLRPKTLFATHYHELNQLADSFDRIQNYHVATKEIGDEIIFLRKLVAGSSEASFGIHVAQLAGMPKSIISRAKNLLLDLESKSIDQKDVVKSTLEKQQSALPTHQLNIFDLGSENYKELEEVITKLDLHTLTPIEAMMKLKELQDLVSEKAKS
jgi:DNA mismatch repair protein MutS